MARTPEELQRDYTLTCAKAGDLQYKISQVKDELGSMHNALNKINQELDKLNKEAIAQAKAANAAAPAPMTKQEVNDAKTAIEATPAA